jgi:hypothetical protein
MARALLPHYSVGVFLSGGVGIGMNRSLGIWPTNPTKLSSHSTKCAGIVRLSTCAEGLASAEDLRASARKEHAHG